MAEDKFPYIQAFPKRPEDKESFPVEVKKGKIKIPKDLIKHAGLDSGRYCITGFPDPPSLKIWNIEIIEKYLFSNKEDLIDPSFYLNIFNMSLISAFVFTPVAHR
ncbi:MAG: hypothetical protein J7K72_05355 [Candidatus Aenigmarchaeota archaeon]|nr:hypothetical protein [Candidatus Aenigmarchaeota archaeon]